MKEKNSVFENLFDINVGDHIEKKNGLSYISWPYAWAEIKKKYPLSKIPFKFRLSFVLTMGGFFWLSYILVKIKGR